MSDPRDPERPAGPEQPSGAPSAPGWAPPPQQDWQPPPQANWQAPQQPGWQPPQQPSGGWHAPQQPSAGWQAPQQPGWQQQSQPGWQPPPKRGLSAGAVVVIVLVGVLVLAVIGFIAFIGSGLGDLMANRTPIGDVTVGQCFDGFSAGDADEGSPSFELAILLGVTVVDCAEPHDGELIGRVQWTQAGVEYPGQQALEDHAAEGCHALFGDYVGIGYDASALEMFYTYPLPPQWQAGARSFECIVHAAAGEEKLTGSVRNSGR
jgi:hypothetical protein